MKGVRISGVREHSPMSRCLINVFLELLKQRIGHGRNIIVKNFAGLIKTINPQR
jgi:hypothetical protein